MWRNQVDTVTTAGERIMLSSQPSFPGDRCLFSLFQTIWATILHNMTTRLQKPSNLLSLWPVSTFSSTTLKTRDEMKQRTTRLREKNNGWSSLKSGTKNKSITRTAQSRPCFLHRDPGCRIPGTCRNLLDFKAPNNLQDLQDNMANILKSTSISEIS